MSPRISSAPCGPWGSATAPGFRSSRASISRYAVGRWSRSPGRTVPARRRSRSSRQGCSRQIEVRFSAAAVRACSCRIPAATRFASAPTRKWLLAAAASSERGPSLHRSASPGTKLAIRATSRAASASGSLSPRCWLRSQISSSSTSRRAESIPPERRSSQLACALRPLREQRSWSPTTSTSPRPPPIERSRSGGRPCLRNNVLIGAGTIAFAASVWAAIDRSNDGLSLLFVALALLAVGMAWLETGPDSAKELALIASLGAAAAAGRVLFAAIPGVQPVTVIAVVAGASLGARSGFAVGTVAAFVSNFFLGQGVWTPWQMLGWGACGVAGALAAPLLRRRLALAAFCFVLGMAFSAFMDVWNWLAFYDEHTWQTFAATHARGLPFDLAHAIGNVVIALAAGPELRRLLDRYGRRLHTEVVWA